MILGRKIMLSRQDILLVEAPQYKLKAYVLYHDNDSLKKFQIVEIVDNECYLIQSLEYNG